MVDVKYQLDPKDQVTVLRFNKADGLVHIDTFDKNLIESLKAAQEKEPRGDFLLSYIIFRKAGESMKPSIIKSKDELPMFLTVMDMAALLGISRSSAYELAAEEGFPKLKLVPGRVILPRDTLFEWLDEQTNFEMVRKEVR